MRLLIYEPSYRRLEAAISGLGGDVEPVLMRDDGTLTLAGGEIGREAARIEAAWATRPSRARRRAPSRSPC